MKRKKIDTLRFLPKRPLNGENLKIDHHIYFQVTIRPMMYIALTYDHRLIDGREAVTFLRSIKRAVEDPRVMFLDL